MICFFGLRLWSFSCREPHIQHTSVNELSKYFPRASLNKMKRKRTLEGLWQDQGWGEQEKIDEGCRAVGLGETAIA